MKTVIELRTQLCEVFDEIREDGIDLNAPTLFDYAAREKPVHGGLRYPAVPGFKRSRTSELAANSIEKESKTLRDQALELLEEKDLTSDEVAMYLHRSILAVRPRLSELQALGLIVETGDRRKNLSGKLAAVLTAKDRAPLGNTDALHCNSHIKDR